MKLRLISILTIIFVLLCSTVEAQKVLLLQKSGTTKRFFYETGDKIIIRTGEPEFVASGVITYIDDSVCTLNKNFTFQLSKVHEVTRARHWFLFSWKKLYLASVLYAGGSMINHAINGDEKVFDNTIPWVSGSFIVSGTAAWLLRYRSCKMENDWQLKVLDYGIFKERNEPQE